MKFPLKNWRNLPSEETPVSAESLRDLEARLAASIENGSILENSVITAEKIAKRTITGDKLALSGEKYGSKTERAFLTEYEPSATRPTFVILEGSVSTGEGGTLQVFVGGEEIASPSYAKPGGMETSTIIFTFPCPAGTKWECRHSLSVAALHSRYLTI